MVQVEDGLEVGGPDVAAGGFAHAGHDEVAAGVEAGPLAGDGAALEHVLHSLEGLLFHDGILLILCCPLGIVQPEVSLQADRCGFRDGAVEEAAFGDVELPVLEGTVGDAAAAVEIADGLEGVVGCLVEGTVAAEAVLGVPDGGVGGEVLSGSGVDGVVPVGKGAGVAAFLLEGAFIFAEEETVPWEEET